MSQGNRSNVVDLMRGFAVALMIVFHFCYDLTYYRFASFDFYHDPFWLNFRTFIVSLFLLVVGISQSLAFYGKVPRNRIIKRLLILLALSLLISIATYFIFPGRTIVFGILHFILVASIIALPFSRHPLASLIFGITAVFIGNTIANELFNQGWLHWIGFMQYKPATEDYVPLFPWLGVVLIGIWVGHTLLSSGNGQRILNADLPVPGKQLLEVAGRHSLLIYILHQPILFGLLWAVRLLV
ncbi:MAG TPA: DUF1624 domain-containing protein [Gammaproteobacteria bacterium]|nr:DUF1624 domain-containing protein [Gammaproteobacteria bacterium]